MSLARPTSRLLLVLAVVGILAATARAEEAVEEGFSIEAIEIQIDVSVPSKYMWRGLALVDDWVLQPSVDLFYGGFDINVWANLDLTDENDQQGNVTEVDLEGSYTFSLAPFELTLGAVTFLYPTGEDGTVELLGHLALDVLLSPSLSIHQDVDESDGTYVALGIAHTFEDLIPLGDDHAVSLELSASLGWGSSDHNDYNYGVGDAALTDLTLGASFSAGLSETLTASASVHYARVLDDDLRDSQDDADNVWFVFSLTLAF